MKNLPASKNGGDGSTAKPAGKRKLSYKEQRELESMEALIVEAENEVERLTRVAEDSSGGATQKIFQDLAAAQKRVEDLYTRWNELSN